MFKSATRELVDALVAAEPGPAAEDALFGLFAEYMVHNYSAELQTYRCRPPLDSQSKFTRGPASVSCIKHDCYKLRMATSHLLPPPPSPKHHLPSKSPTTLR